MSLNRSRPNFARCLAVTWAGTLHTFSGVLAPFRNFARCIIHLASKFCPLVFWQRHCTALQQQASAKLCGVEQRAPPIFGRVTITLGIGPHSRFFSVSPVFFHLTQWFPAWIPQHPRMPWALYKGTVTRCQKKRSCVSPSQIPLFCH